MPWWKRKCQRQKEIEDFIDKFCAEILLQSGSYEFDGKYLFHFLKLFSTNTFSNQMIIRLSRFGNSWSCL